MPRRPPTLKASQPRCQRAADATRPAPSRRGYGRDWQRARLWKLSTEPWCAACLARGLYCAATEVDHRTALSAGGTNDADNLESLCKPCHSRKTVAVDGGLGRAKQQPAG